MCSCSSVFADDISDFGCGRRPAMNPSSAELPHGSMGARQSMGLQMAIGRLLARDNLNKSDAVLFEIAPLVLCHRREIGAHEHAP